MRLASRFGYAAKQIRRDRPLTHEELMQLKQWLLAAFDVCHEYNY